MSRPLALGAALVRLHDRFREDIAGIDCSAFLDSDRQYAPSFGGADFVLHLHGFDDGDSLPCGHLIAFVHQHAHDLTGHGGFQGLPRLLEDALQTRTAS